MQEVDWVGNDVWFAHAVWVNDEEIQVFAKHNCGVAHCPTSNMRLASGILTAGLIDRQRAYETLVTYALAPWLAGDFWA